MRAVALSEPAIQEQIAKSFVPLKAVIKPGDPEFPLDWPSLAGFRIGYALLKGHGYMGCMAVSPDLKTVYAHPGSALVWEMFECAAYDAKKFSAMLDRALARANQEQEIRADPALKDRERERRLARFRSDVEKEVRQETPFHLPPKGFRMEDATELFRLAGEIPGK